MRYRRDSGVYNLWKIAYRMRATGVNLGDAVCVKDLIGVSSIQGVYDSVSKLRKAGVRITSANGVYIVKELGMWSSPASDPDNLAFWGIKFGELKEVTRYESIKLVASEKTDDGWIITEEDEVAVAPLPAVDINDTFHIGGVDSNAQNKSYKPGESQLTVEDTNTGWHQDVYTRLATVEAELYDISIELGELRSNTRKMVQVAFENILVAIVSAKDEATITPGSSADKAITRILYAVKAAQDVLAVALEPLDRDD